MLTNPDYLIVALLWVLLLSAEGVVPLPVAPHPVLLALSVFYPDTRALCVSAVFPGKSVWLGAAVSTYFNFKTLMVAPFILGGGAWWSPLPAMAFAALALLGISLPCARGVGLEHVYNGKTPRTPRAYAEEKCIRATTAAILFLLLVVGVTYVIGNRIAAMALFTGVTILGDWVILPRYVAFLRVCAHECVQRGLLDIVFDQRRPRENVSCVVCNTSVNTPAYYCYELDEWFHLTCFPMWSRSLIGADVPVENRVAVE